MNYFFGILVGFVWGGLVALLNGFVTKRCVEKNTSAAMTTANTVKIASYILAFAVVFLLRNFLPFSYEAVIIGTVLAISMLQIVISYRIAGSK